MEYFRPKTRGELVDKITEGVPCEVATSVVEFTNMCLAYWLGLDSTSFTVRPSENEGWVVYELDA